jgi:hypothetical protein
MAEKEAFEPAGKIFAKKASRTGGCKTGRGKLDSGTRPYKGGVE